ncbi:MAG: hypothetical protein N2255_09880 [Kiritimatiellae bacterium]|nr:hypothetical protein [Kiritimatiellia bacterium]
MTRYLLRTGGFLTIRGLLWFLVGIIHGADYDPLSVPAQNRERIVDLVVNDVERPWDIPIRIYLPQTT